MDKIIIYIQQLYNENETIRRDSERELNNIFTNIINIQSGFQQLHTLESQLQLKYFIYLKNFLNQNYEITPNYIQKQLQTLILDQISQYSKLQGSIIQLFCELFVQIAVQSLPQLQMLEFIVKTQKYELIHIRLLTAILSNKYLLLKMRTLNQYQENVVQIFNPMNIQNLQILSDFYLVLSKLISKGIIVPLNELSNILIKQFSQILILNGFEYDILRNFTKSIYHVCLISKPTQQITTELFYLLVNTYMQSEKQRINNKYYAYQILKLLNKINIFQDIKQIEIYVQEQIILFTMINLLMLEKDEYFRLSQDFNDDDDPDYFIEKIRKFAASFLFHITGIFDESFIFSKLLSIQQLISIDEKHEIFECIKKEAHYYLLNQILYQLPLNFIDQLSIQELIMVLKQQQPIYIPLKMQTLNLMKKLLMQNMIDKSQHNHIIKVIYEQISNKLINYPIYLCKNVEILIQFHQKYQNQITIQTYFELKQLYQVQKKLLHKQTILMTMAEIDSLDLGDLSIIQIINDEWTIGLNEKNKFKYQLKMLLNVLYYILEIFSLQKINIIIFGILKITQTCFQIQQHQYKALELLNFSFRKYTPFQSINCPQILNEIKILQTLIHENLYNDQELYKQVVIFYYLILIHDIANIDLAFQFISQEQVIKNNLQLLCALFYNIKKGQYIEIIQSFYQRLLSEVIYDDGKTYSELICGLSILDINGYDIKELLIQIENNIPEKILNIMIFKGSNHIKTYNQYYHNYLINYFNCILNKQNIQFDLEQLTLEVNDNTFNLQQYVLDMGQVLKSNKLNFSHYLQKIFENQFLLKIQLCDQLIKKYNIPEQKTKEEIDMQNLSLT